MARAGRSGSPTVLGNEAYYLGYCFRSGMFGIEPPRRLAQLVRAFNDYGMLGAGVAVAAIRHPQRAGGDRRARSADLPRAR